ncbi:extracellular solute-binding protein [Microbacterium sp. MEC084]|nr:extracellular solute-binding protein [Microbacterium sp. MEC084]
MPLDMGVLSFFCRADLFEQYGVEVPTTWDEHVAAAEAVKAADPNVRIGATTLGDPALYAALAWQHGATWASVEGDAWKIDSAETAERSTPSATPPMPRRYSATSWAPAPPSTSTWRRGHQLRPVGRREPRRSPARRGPPADHHELRLRRPIDERGEPTEKYRLFREALLEFRASAGDESEVPDVPEPLPWLDEATIALSPATGSALAASGAVRTPYVPQFEDLGLDQGVAIHTAELRGPREANADGRLVGAGAGTELSVDLPEIPAGSAVRIDLVVDSLGRVNYGPMVGERKGITGQVMHERQLVHGFTSRTARLDDLHALAPWEDEDAAALDAVAPLAFTGSFARSAAATRASRSTASTGASRS